MKPIDKRDELKTEIREDILSKIFNNQKVPDQYLSLTDLDVYMDNTNLYQKINKGMRLSLLNESITLTKSQEECLSLLEQGDLFISAPTSFGKTYIALEHIERNIDKYNNIIFVVPTISLMNELRFSTFKYFGSVFSIITSESELMENIDSAKKIIITVPERIRTKEFSSYIKGIKVDFLVYDEIYKLHANLVFHENDDRIITMNHVYKMLLEKTDKVLLLGPFINSVSFARSKRKIQAYFSDLNLVYNEVGIWKDESIIGREGDKRFVYFKSPASINKFVRNEEYLGEKQETQADIIKWLSDNIHQDWYYIKYLEYGVGIHHGKTPLFLRKYIEEEYRKGDIHTVLCTSTLIEGINTPTESLFIYDEPHNVFALNNLMGRVGRLNVNNPTIGKIIFKDSNMMEMYNEENWLDLNIVYEEYEVVTKKEEDEYLFLDKKIDDAIKDRIGNFKNELKCKYNINYHEVIELGIEYRVLHNFVNAFSEIVTANSEFEVLKIIKTKILNVEAKYLSGLQKIKYSDNVKNNVKDNSDFIYVGADPVLSLLMGGSIGKVIASFEKHNSSRTIEDINVFIDCIFEMDKYIKFQLTKLIPIYDLFVESGNEEINNSGDLFQLISAVKGYSDSKDGYDRILSDIGFPEQDILILRKAFKKLKKVKGTENKLGQINNTEIFNQLSPFGKKIVERLE